MTKVKLLELLRDIAKYSDSLSTSRDHRRADIALLAYVDDEEVTLAFEAIKKWYE